MRFDLRLGGQTANSNPRKQQKSRKYCVLNPDPLQPGRCDEQQTKIGRILLEIEANDKRFMAATDELMASIKSIQTRE